MTSKSVQPERRQKALTSRLVSARFYAEHRGCSRTSVVRAIQARRLETSLYPGPNGERLIDVDAADLEWMAKPAGGESGLRASDLIKAKQKADAESRAQTEQQTKQRARPKPPLKRIESAPEVRAPVDPAPELPPREPVQAALPMTEVPDLFTSRSLTEAMKARLATLQVEEKEGRLCSVDAVRAEGFNIARRFRDQLLLLPPRLAPVLAAEVDPAVIETWLVRELNDVLTSLSGLSQIPS